VAEALRKEPGVEVELVEGKPGELKVLVDGQVAARKWLFFKPSVEKVLKVVRATTPAETRS
jgi:hypothetical protein